MYIWRDVLNFFLHVFCVCLSFTPTNRPHGPITGLGGTSSLTSLSEKTAVPPGIEPGSSSFKAKRVSQPGYGRICLTFDQCLWYDGMCYQFGVAIRSCVASQQTIDHRKVTSGQRYVAMLLVHYKVTFLQRLDNVIVTGMMYRQRPYDVTVQSATSFCKQIVCLPQTLSVRHSNTPLQMNNNIQML
ncbi:Uncharacterised protein r2_g4295 [Pycnogonum litorale]